MTPSIPSTLLFALPLFLSVLVTYISAEKKDSDTLILSQLLWRHGDRSPTTLFPTYNHTADSVWPMGLGALTRRGMKQQFLLGKELRKKFKGYLGETYNSKDITITSTNYDRTLMSAQMNMAGLYGWLSTGQDIAENLSDIPWKFSQPIPIHPDDAGILSPGKNCPAFGKELERVEKRSLDARRNREENGTLIDYIKYQSGNLSLKLMRIADTVFCSRQHRIPLPPWIANNQTVKDYLNFYYYDLSARLYMDRDDEKLAILGGGPLLTAMVENMRDKIAGNLTQKVIAYSAHDTTVMALLAALRVFDGKQPFYASMVAVDLYRTVSKSGNKSRYSVEVKYLYGTLKPDITKIKTLVIPGCSHRCALVDVIRLLGDNMPEDRTSLCFGDRESPEEALGRDRVILSLSMVIALLVATLFFSCVYFLVRQRRMRNLLPTARFSLVEDGEIEASVPLTSHYDDGDMYGYNSG